MQDDKPLKTNKSAFIVAGPCSVESRMQLRSVALSLRGKVDLVRCGVWKPRTRPGGFEGLGEPALQWMQELATEYPELRFCCEVARPEHIDLCLRYGVRNVWIGARTSGDPFCVSELAEAMKGTGMSVMVKNPSTPDEHLWQGAIERIISAGIADVKAVHRGFYLYNDASGYRNNPLWEVPIELRRHMPEIPILCDPSHMGGRRDCLAKLMQCAADLGADGYMIEVHSNPAEALTDAEQQVTPEEFEKLLGMVVSRDSGSQDADIYLQQLRSQIDNIDSEMLRLLADRMKVSQSIARVKAQNNLAIYQPNRLQQVLDGLVAEGERLGLSPQLVADLYEKVHAESVRVQLQETDENKI